MRIAICLSDLELAKKAFGYTAELARGIKFRGDVRNIGDSALLERELAGNCFAWDIFFLDGQDKNCLNIASRIRRQNFIASIVFIVDRTKKKTDLFQYRPSAVITDLENNEQMKTALIRTCQEQVRANPFFTIRNKEEIFRIAYSDILWFESRQRIVVLHSAKQEISFYAKLSEVYDLLPKELFFRCHQSYIVNGGKIRRVDKNQKYIYLASGDTVEISRRYYSQVISFCTENLSSCLC